MSTYLKNLSLLKKSLGYPVLELPQSEPPAHSAIEIIEARKSSITLIYKGKYLHSRFDPIKESKQILSRLLPGGLSYDIIILAGMGAGHFLTALANYEIDKIIVFEPDIDLFKQILKQELISSILKSHGNKLFITSKLEEMIKFFNSIYHYGLKSKLIIPPIYEQMFPAQTKLLVKHLSETRLNIDGIETTELADSFTWMKNFWQNLPIILNNHSS